MFDLCSLLCSIRLRCLIELLLLFPLIFRTIDGKPQICNPPTEWLVDRTNHTRATANSNGTSALALHSPLADLTGSVTRLGVVVQFLRSTGMKDVAFVILNSKDAADRFERLQQLAGQMGIQSYQESESAPVWSWLNASTNDMFIYDRCGRLSYYVPYPLSLLDPNQPIIQATVLSAYFDNPCASSCSNQNRSQSIARNWMQQSAHSFDSMSSEASSVQVEAKSHLQLDSDSVVEARHNFSVPSPWQIFRFFMDRQANRTRSNLDPSPTTPASETESIVTTTTRKFLFASTDTSLKASSTGLQSSFSHVSLPMEPIYKPNSTSVPHPDIRCDQLSKSICIEFSTDRLLRGRLCCLNDGLSSIGGGLGCKRFNKAKCNEMLPQIKCCLQDFSQLLKDYFNSHKET